MDGVIWSRLWRPVHDGVQGGEAVSLQKTLESELTKAHPLYSYRPKPFGRCIANDDVAALLNDGRIAVIHLSWKGKPDPYPDKYPSWGCFNTVEAFNRAIEDEEG